MHFQLCVLVVVFFNPRIVAHQSEAEETTLSNWKRDDPVGQNRVKTDGDHVEIARPITAEKLAHQDRQGGVRCPDCLTDKDLETPAEQSDKVSQDVLARQISKNAQRGQTGQTGPRDESGPIGPGGRRGKISPDGQSRERRAIGQSEGNGPAGPSGPSGSGSPAGPSGPSGSGSPAGPGVRRGEGGPPGQSNGRGSASPAGPSGNGGPAGPARRGGESGQRYKRSIDIQFREDKNVVNVVQEEEELKKN